MSLEDDLPNLFRSRAKTAEILVNVRAKAAEFCCDRDIVIGTVGSFARGEATSESDLDFFAICPREKGADAKKILVEVGPKLVDIVGKPPSTTGAFNEVELLEDMLVNIGGQDDSNEKITRRVLLLLEGSWLTNEHSFPGLQRQLFEKYVRPSISAHQLCLFLLNDIIRYYRTMCVDFDHKTIENKKPWGIRNIKLVYSRKLIYFSAIIIIAETYQRSYFEKMRIMTEGFAKTPTQRLLDICGDAAIPALKLYDDFLGALDNPEMRRELENTAEGQRNENETFRRLKDNGHHFSIKLMNLLDLSFGRSHPIHRALVL
jgi:predicted nucleotidyltransferase